jgi:regulator of sigma E protease
MIFALQLVLSLSLLIILHEAGHFIPARFFKTRVEKFYLFFDPYFSLFKKKVGDTEYGIGWLPLGGYVKISGMIDESMDKEQLAKPAEKWEFRAKPAWQRLIIMVGGVVVNIIIGIVIYTGIVWHSGEDILPVHNVKYGVHVHPILRSYGLQDGDIVLSLDGEEPTNYHDINKRLILDAPRSITVERLGEKLTFNLPEDIGQVLIDSNVRSGAFSLRLPYVIDSLAPGMPAASSGLLPGDSVFAVNDVTSIFFQDIATEIRNHPSDSITIRVKRGEQELAYRILVNAEGTIGVYSKTPEKFVEYEHIDYGFFASIPAGISLAWETLTDYGSQLRFLFSKSGASQVGGFVTFAKLFPPQWDWLVFWERTAFISLILAFMNILPIPALDGGHVMFLTWEMITGKAVNQKVLEIAQMVGMFLLLGLLLYANGMDIVRLFSGNG